MVGRANTRRWFQIGTALLVVALAGACGGTPGADKTSGSPTAGATVQKSGFEKLGPVTLTIWSYDNQDPGLEPVLKELSNRFTTKYPNVKINMVFKDFNSLVNTVPRALASDSGPDITEGNQGYQTDAALVKAGLIRSLEPYIQAYGWNDWYTDSTWQIFQWTEDGKTFGEGPKWGVAQTGQNVVVFANKQKLQDLGYDPASMPQSFDEFDTMLGDIRQKLPKDEPVIQFGNLEGYGTIHMYGGIQAAFVDPQSVRDWIMHVPGSSYDTPENVQALKTYQEWAQNGYFNSDYNAVKYDASAANFAKGSGVFWMGGDWDSSIVKEGLGDNATVLNIPPGASGTWASIGATSGPWHISSKTKYPDLAAAWLDYIIASPEAHELMYGQQQIPSITGASQPSGDPFLGEVTAAWQQVSENDGLMLYTDWASPTMYDTLASNFQELLAGKKSPEDMAKAVQGDWEKFDASLK
jgi:raffinose/stachyose/melibiose transport system substrate-binding protein